MLLLLGIGFIIGTFLGSLIQCLSLRAVNKESFWGRSYCRECKKTLQWYDLFPVLSYLCTLGKCRYCKKNISKEYFLIELITGFLSALIFWNFPLASLDLNNLYQLVITYGELVFQLFILVILEIAFLTDIRTGLIPDRITYPAVVISLIYKLIFTIIYGFAFYQSLDSSPLGKYLLPPYSDYFYRHLLIISEPLIYSLFSALGIGLFFGGLIILTRGKGMGGGDFKLGIFIGLALGFPQGVVAILLAFLLGSVIGLALMFLNKKKFKETIPFGPFLSLGSLVALLWGERLYNWYFSLQVF